MSRILWLSNAPWAGSGYGQQSALFGPRLAALGHDVAFQSNFGLRGKVDTWNGFTVYPGDVEWGNQSVATWAEKHEADLVIALCDAFVLNPEKWPDLRIAVWAPVDHTPVPVPVGAILSHERVQPIAMSRDGEAEMNKVKLDPLYVPHGIDTAMFRPRPGRRDLARDALQIPRDAFLVGMVAANTQSSIIHRKAYPEAFAAFSLFAQQHSDAWLYAHTDPHEAGGMNLEELATMRGVPEKRLRFLSEKAIQLGISSELMASTIYQAMDVLLAPSMGEGFGIPILEAQACGVPVITSKWTAMTELCQAGWLVDGQPFWDPAAKADFYMPAIQSIAAALEAAYDSRADMRLRAAAADFAKEYDANKVTVDYWQPALERLLAQPAAESRQVRRARERKARKKAAA